MRETSKHKHIKAALKQIPPPNIPTVIRICSFLHRFVHNPEVNAKKVLVIWSALLFGAKTELNKIELPVVSSLSLIIFFIFLIHLLCSGYE